MGAVGQGVGGAAQGITGAAGDVVGSSGNQQKSGSEASASTSQTTDRLDLDPAAISRIIEEVLSGPQGLASIFAGEQTAGVFNSSTAAQASGDLAARLVGELAKLTGEKVSTTQKSSQSVFDESTLSSQAGLLEQAFGFKPASISEAHKNPESNLKNIFGL